MKRESFCYTFQFVRHSALPNHKDQTEDIIHTSYFVTWRSLNTIDWYEKPYWNDASPLENIPPSILENWTASAEGQVLSAGIPQWLDPQQGYIY